jgi:hypothetical protein
MPDRRRGSWNGVIPRGDANALAARPPRRTSSTTPPGELVPVLVPFVLRQEHEPAFEHPAKRRALQLKTGQAACRSSRPRALKQLCASPSERYPAFVELQPTEWRLRTSCPDCQQGSLLLVACPGCSHVAVVCEEDGLAFADVQAVRTVAWGDGDVSCPQCGKHQLKSFAAATSAQLLGSGLTLADYY